MQVWTKVNTIWMLPIDLKISSQLLVLQKRYCLFHQRKYLRMTLKLITFFLINRKNFQMLKMPVIQLRMLYVLITVKKSCSHSSFVYYCSFLINKLMKYLYMSYCFVSQINALFINKNELIINKNFNSQIPMSKMKLKWKKKVVFAAS